MFNASANFLSNKRIFTFLNKRKKTVLATAYFRPFITTESEERLAATLSRTISMR